MYVDPQPIRLTRSQTRANPNIKLSGLYAKPIRKNYQKHLDLPNIIERHPSKSTTSNAKVCTACCERHHELFKAGCIHSYCLEYLNNLAKQSLQDRNLVPMRCCKIPIPLHLLKKCFVSKDLLKYEEFL